MRRVPRRARVGGWIAAKVKGTKQLIQVMTGTFPQPIPPPDHADLPKTELTCMECHSVDRLTAAGGSVQVVLRPRFQTDKANTRELVAVAIRPSGMGEGTQGGGVHWHIAQNVRTTTDEEHDQTISSVSVERPGGEVVRFIAASEIGTSNNVGPDFDRLSRADQPDDGLHLLPQPGGPRCPDRGRGARRLHRRGSRQRRAPVHQARRRRRAQRRLRLGPGGRRRDRPARRGF